MSEAKDPSMIDVGAKTRRIGRALDWPRALAIATAGAIALHLLLRFARTDWKGLSNIPLYVVLIVGGMPLLVQLARRLWAREFGSDFLAGVSILTAALLREYLVVCIVVLILSGGTALSSVGMFFASWGVLPRIAGTVAQELIDVAAVLNAVRVALPFKDLRDFEAPPFHPTVVLFL
jgi:cation transport ATPase